MTRIKICGITTDEDARLCVEAGVQALGFVVEYPVDVPWNLLRQRAQELMRSIPPFVSRVIVVGDDYRTVVESTRLLKPHAVQLHGNESISDTRILVAAIHDLGAQVIKPLRFSAETGSCQSACADPLGAAELIAKTGVDALVLDSVSETRPAGTGRSIDWHLAGRIRDSIRQPVILAGGLHADNVTDAIRTVRPYAVDVISGVEDPVGRKNPEKVRAFVDAVSRAGRPAPLTPAEWLACHNDMFALSDRRTDSPQGFSEEHT